MSRQWVGVMALCAMLMVGCSESVDHQLQKARLHLTNGKATEAIRIAENVLKTEPTNIEAQRIKAESHLRLKEFAAGRGLIEQLLAQDANDGDARRLMTQLALMQTADLMQKSQFVTDATMQAAFDNLLEQGMAQAAWVEEHEKDVADAEDHRSRFVQQDLRRHQQILNFLRSSLTEVELQGADFVADAEGRIAETQKRIAAVRQALGRHLKRAIEADPSRVSVRGRYAQHLRQTDQWSAIWEQAEQVAALDDVPDWLASELATSLLAMPNSVRGESDRLAMSRRLLEAVDKDDRRSTTYRLIAGRVHLQAGEYAKAEDQLSRVVRSDGRNLNGRFFLAQTYHLMDRNEDAKEHIQTIAQNPQGRNLANVQLLQGKILRALGDHRMALEAINRAIDLAPGDQRLRSEKILLMADMDQLQEASDDVDAMLEANPSDPRILQYKLAIESARGNRLGVTRLLETVLEQSPITTDHVRILADGYLYLEDHEKAELYARRLVSREPDEIENHLRLARALLETGQDEQVRTLLTGVREQFPQSASVDEMLGRLYLDRDQLDRAVELLESTVDLEPRNLGARLALARALAGMAMTDAAIAQIDYVLDRDPNNTNALALASRIYDLTGDSEKAQQFIERIDAEDVDERAMPLAAARLALLRGNEDEAVQICNRALARSSRDPALRLMLAQIYLRWGELDKAHEHLVALATARPNNLQAWQMLGRFYISTQRVDQGLTELARMDAMNPAYARLTRAALLTHADRHNDAIALLAPLYEAAVDQKQRVAAVIADSLAGVYRRQGNGDGAYGVYELLAQKDYQAAFGRLRQLDMLWPQQTAEANRRRLDDLAAMLKPEDQLIRFQAMRRYTALGAFDRAHSVLEQWITAQPDEAVLWRWKGELLFEQQRYREAVTALSEAIRLAPDNVRHRLTLANAYERMYDFPAAVETYEALGKLDTGAAMLAEAQIGTVFLELGLTDQATRHFARLEQIGRPGDPRVYYQMGKAYFALKEFDKAFDRLSRVPAYAPQYVPAQIMMARIEQARGEFDAGKKRLMGLIGNQRFARVLIGELVSLNMRAENIKELLVWTDANLAVQSLPAKERIAWLRLRALMAAEDEDWGQVLDATQRITAVDDQDFAASLAQVLLLVRENDLPGARGVAGVMPQRAREIYGPSVAVLLGEQPALPADRLGLLPFFEAVAIGNLDHARTIVDKLQPNQWAFRSDLRAMLEREDVTGPAMQAAMRKLLGAMVAIDIGMPRLGQTLAESVSTDVPDLLVAELVKARALGAMNKPIDQVLVRIRGQERTMLHKRLLADQHMRDDNPAAAIGVLEDMLEAEPDNDHLRYAYAKAQQHAGDMDAAIAALRAVPADSSYAVIVMNDLAYLLAEHQPEARDEAHRIAMTAYEAAPNFPALLDTIGWIEHLRGNDEQARMHLSRAVAQLSDVPEVHYHLGVVFEALGNRKWAIHHLSRAAQGPADLPESRKAVKMMEGWER